MIEILINIGNNYLKCLLDLPVTWQKNSFYIEIVLDCTKPKSLSGNFILKEKCLKRKIQQNIKG
jgi:hypothetical protein